MDSCNVADLAVCLLVPVDAIMLRAPRDVSPHGVVKVNHVEPVIHGHATGEVVSQQDIITKYLTEQSITVVKMAYAGYPIISTGKYFTALSTG